MKDIVAYILSVGGHSLIKQWYIYMWMYGEYPKTEQKHVVSKNCS